MVEQMERTNRTVCITDARRIRCNESAPRNRNGQDGFARLASSVLAQAMDDAAFGIPVDVESLRPWAVVAGIPFSQIEMAIARPWLTRPAA